MDKSVKKQLIQAEAILLKEWLDTPDHAKKDLEKALKYLSDCIRAID